MTTATGRSSAGLLAAALLAASCGPGTPSVPIDLHRYRPDDLARGDLVGADLAGGPRGDLGPADLLSPPVDLAVGDLPTGDLAVAPRPDLAVARDMAGVNRVSCNGKFCASGASCCILSSTKEIVCVSSGCASGDIPVRCDGPEDCAGSPCCGLLDHGKLATISCSSGPADCVPSVNLSTNSGMTRMCHSSDDCSRGLGSSNFPDCCKGTLDNQTVQLCFVKSLAGILGFACQ